MYQIEGSDFTDLIKREFTDKFVVKERTISIQDKFDFRTKNFRDEHFDILHCQSNIHTPLQINSLKDTTHVSLHFQLTGYSAAHISGFESAPGTGNFNLLNCVDPVSTFVYPQKGAYEYLCVGFEPAYFDGIIAECEAFCDRTLAANAQGVFPFFSKSRMTDYWQMDTVKLIRQAPVPDSLKVPYIRSKVKELALLTFSRFFDEPVKSSTHLNLTDIERLHEVKAFLEVNYLDKLTLEKISRTFLLNEFKLKSGFKRQFGITVFGYIQQLRLEHAYKILIDGALTIRETAFLIGYESDTAFIRAFKLFFNCSPGKIKGSYPRNKG